MVFCLRKPALSGWHTQILPVTVVLIALLLLPAPPVRAVALQSGRVQSGETPMAFSTVTLYRAGSQSSSPVALGQAESSASGFFSISYTPPSDSGAVLYLIADLGSPVPASQEPKPARAGIKLATALGTQPVPTNVVINERTTVATAFAMAQFLDHDEIAGRAPGLQNAAATARNLVDLTTGEVGSALGNPPNGLLTSTMRTFNSLANMLASCVHDSRGSVCRTLFSEARPPGGPPPGNTLQAALNIAHYPWHNVRQLFARSRTLVLYEPALESAPDAWPLAIRYNGNGHEFNGPGNMSIDKDGNVWITNNYQFNLNPRATVCGDDHVLKLTPTGADAPGAPYQGGGLYGAGFGITLDPRGDVWVSNFGFQGSTCSVTSPNNSVSKFSPDGVALSPAGTGFFHESIKQPQGTASDRQGNIWIVNCGNDSITQFSDGDPKRVKNFHDIGLEKPFGLAIDAQGNAWITSTGNDSVVVLAPDGSPIYGSPITRGGIKAPMGVAIDSLGNAWIANSQIINPPCPSVELPSPGGVASITGLKPNGQPVDSAPFTGGGLTIPWGIAVDGNDNIWVANFGGQRLSQFCGARTSKCPRGLHTGDPVSPATGYSSDALERNTGLAIDPSGNVWVANNWLNVPLQTNPGAHALVVFIGIAAPIQTPLIGPPR